MKKLLAIILMAVMTITVLAGCSNPIYDDLSNYLNNEMAEINADYTNLTTEVAKWADFEDDAALAESINTVLLPLVDGMLTKLEAVSPATEEVKALKAKFAEMLESYKTGFETLAEGCVTQDDATIEAGNAGIEKGIELLDEYNTALEALAKQVGGEIEY